MPEFESRSPLLALRLPLPHCLFHPRSFLSWWSRCWASASHPAQRRRAQTHRPARRSASSASRRKELQHVAPLILKSQGLLVDRHSLKDVWRIFLCEMWAKYYLMIRNADGCYWWSEAGGAVEARFSQCVSMCLNTICVVAVLFSGVCCPFPIFVSCFCAIFSRQLELLFSFLFNHINLFIPWLLFSLRFIKAPSLLLL